MNPLPGRGDQPGLTVERGSPSSTHNAISEHHRVHGIPSGAIGPQRKRQRLAQSAPTEYRLHSMSPGIEMRDTSTLHDNHISSTHTLLNNQMVVPPEPQTAMVATQGNNWNSHNASTMADPTWEATGEIFWPQGFEFELGLPYSPPEQGQLC